MIVNKLLLFGYCRSHLHSTKFLILQPAASHFCPPHTNSQTIFISSRTKTSNQTVNINHQFIYSDPHHLWNPTHCQTITIRPLLHQTNSWTLGPYSFNILNTTKFLHCGFRLLKWKNAVFDLNTCIVVCINDGAGHHTVLYTSLWIFYRQYCQEGFMRIAERHTRFRDSVCNFERVLLFEFTGFLILKLYVH